MNIMKKRYIKPKSRNVQLDPDELMLQQMLTLSGGEQGMEGAHGEAKFDEWEDEGDLWANW